MDTNTLHICELCREVVDPADRNVLFAREMHEVVTFGGRSRVEGLGVYFHKGCFPSGTRYQLATDSG